MEEARFNPQTVASDLEKKNSFGSKGSFKGTFSNFTGKFHSGNDSEVLNSQLADAYKLSFVTNAENTRRTEKYCEAFKSYTDYMKINEFGLDNIFTRINWNILPDIFLGGNSPILCSNDSRNIAFSIEENSVQWEDQLKYPLFQMYLAEHYCKCDVDKVEVGIFNIHTKGFEFKVFEDVELDNAFEETKGVLRRVKSYLDGNN
ncbi:MAG: hypothetical protein EOO93_09940 [Pedobacter sp.]|nr:MAG: hypothetical protein EOO93_09940 [Pedobacter sp.]